MVSWCHGWVVQFPECYTDSRYGAGNHPGRVCVGLAFRRIMIRKWAPASLTHKYLKISYTPPNISAYVRSDNTQYLRGKFRPETARYLATLEAQNGFLIATPLTEHRRQSFWSSGNGTWVNGAIHMGFVDSQQQLVNRIGVPTANYTHITWSDGWKRWINCTTLPANCTVMYHPFVTDRVVYHLKRRIATSGGKEKGYEFTVPVGKGRVYDMEWDLVENQLSGYMECNLAGLNQMIWPHQHCFASRRRDL